jgi:hypothetical protein
MFGLSPQFHKIGQGNKAEGPGRAGGSLGPPNQEALRAASQGRKSAENAIRARCAFTSPYSSHIRENRGLFTGLVGSSPTRPP